MWLQAAQVQEWLEVTWPVQRHSGPFQGYGLHSACLGPLWHWLPQLLAACFPVACFGTGSVPFGCLRLPGCFAAARLHTA